MSYFFTCFGVIEINKWPTFTYWRQTLFQVTLSFLQVCSILSAQFWLLSSHLSKYTISGHLSPTEETLFLLKGGGGLEKMITSFLFLETCCTVLYYIQCSIRCSLGASLHVQLFSSLSHAIWNYCPNSWQLNIPSHFEPTVQMAQWVPMLCFPSVHLCGLAGGT